MEQVFRECVEFIQQQSNKVLVSTKTPKGFWQEVVTEYLKLNEQSYIIVAIILDILRFESWEICKYSSKIHFCQSWRSRGQATISSSPKQLAQIMRICKKLRSFHNNFMSKVPTK